MEDSVLVLAAGGRADLKVRGSRFLAESHAVRSTAEVEQLLERERRATHDASHHCFAYRLLEVPDAVRYSDDGEPSGTAGLPILRQIDRRGVSNALVVVVRYFGGTKLGTGGLVRAYGEAASAALDAGVVREHILTTRFSLRFAYGDTAAARRLIAQFGATVESSEYLEQAQLIVSIRRTRANDFMNEFINYLKGRGEIRAFRSEDRSSKRTAR